MKILNFTAKEILPSLLDKSKTQTIRPAWFDKKEFKSLKKANRVVLGIADAVLNEVEKPARYKKGDKIRLMWKQRSSPKDSMFCKECGKEWTAEMEGENLPEWCGHHKDIFPKVLGTGVVTDVFQIEMVRGHLTKLLLINGVDAQKLWKLDGFKSGKDFNDYFINHYDLSSPKKFWCVRWRWC